MSQCDSHLIMKNRKLQNKRQIISMETKICTRIIYYQKQTKDREKERKDHKIKGCFFHTQKLFFNTKCLPNNITHVFDKQMENEKVGNDTSRNQGEGFHRYEKNLLRQLIAQ